VWIAATLYAIPLVWMAAVSIRPAAQAAAAGVNPLPSLPEGDPAPKWSVAYWSALAGQSSENYSGVWNSPAADFPTYFRNTLMVGVLSVLGMTLASAVAAYGFSRLRWPGRDGVFVLVLLTLMIPQAVLMSPQYLLFKKMGLIGTMLPLWLPAWFGGAFSIFLLRQFFMTIPRELEEAARIDGCSHWGTFLRIILPLSRPALLVVALMQAVATWNDFLGPLLYLNREEQYTLSLGLQMFQSQHGGTPWNLVMAASVIVVAPVLVLYVAARRFFVGGVGAGGVKE